MKHTEAKKTLQLQIDERHIADQMPNSLPYSILNANKVLRVHIYLSETIVYKIEF
jgi:hypothetical protein